MKILPTQIPPSPGAEEVDLHLHTSASDGLLSEKKLVDLLRADDVAVAAITDHDRIEAPRDPVLRRYLEELGDDAPQIVPGVEITCSLEAPVEQGGSQEVHIIGLGCNPRHPELRKALIELRLGQDAALRDCVERLRADGYDISYSHLGRATGPRMATEGAIAKLLVDAGYATNINEAKVSLVLPRLATYRELPQRITMDTDVAIRLIQQAGGVAIIAHPQRNVPSHDADTLRRLLETLKAQGLDGAEAYRHQLNDELRTRYEAVIREAGLLVSGGSDFHKPFKGGVRRAPGDVEAPASLWPPIERLIRERGGVTDVRDLEMKPVEGASAAERFRLGRR